jgi:drug/metabolite transporter (DMT)-like permease
MKALIFAVILIFALSRGAQRIFTALALESLDAWSVTTYSLLFACLIWFPVAWFKKWLIFDRQLWLTSIPLGIVNIAIPAIAFTAAQMFVTAGVAALFVAFLPIMVAMLGLLFLKEKLSLTTIAGVSIATVGVSVLTLSRSGALDASNWWLGVLLLTVGVISAAFVYVGWRKLLSERPGVEILAPQLAISLFTVAVPTILFGQPGNMDYSLTILLTMLGVVNYIIPQIAMFWLIVRTTAVRSALANYLAPIFAIILGAVFVNQPVTVTVLIGGILVIIGAVFVNTGKLKQPSR